MKIFCYITNPTAVSLYLTGFVRGETLVDEKNTPTTFGTVTMDASVSAKRNNFVKAFVDFAFIFLFVCLFNVNLSLSLSLSSLLFGWSYDLKWKVL